MNRVEVWLDDTKRVAGRIVFASLEVMKWGLSVIALALVSLVSAGTAWGLDADSRRRADEYLEILKKNPVGSPVVDPLWTIYEDADEEETLLAWSREHAGEMPVVSARILMRGGQQEDAVTILRAAAFESPAAAETLAEVLARKGDVAGAVAAIELALKQADSPGLLFRLGELAARAGDTQKARQAWEQAAAGASDDAGLRKKLAAAYARSGDLAGASAQATALTAPADRVTAWEQIARELELRGDFSAAVVAQETLLGFLGPGHWKRPFAENHLLTLEESGGTLEALRDRWQREADERPHDAEAALRMVALEKFSENFPAALGWMQKAGERRPRDVELAVATARLALSLGKLDDAVAASDRALALRLQDAEVIFLRAELSALLGDPSEAETRVAAYLAQNPNDPDAAARAESFYRRLRLTGPLERRLTENFNANRSQVAAATDLANFLLDAQRFPEAAKALSRFEAGSISSAESAAIALQFSALLREAGRRKDALIWARQAWKDAPENVDAALVLADLLKTDGDEVAAREVLESAGDAAPGLPREDLDRCVFLARQEADEEAKRNAEEVFPRSDVLVREMIAMLGESARAETGEEKDWLRWGRWLNWQGDLPEAVVALHDGLRRNPDSLAIRTALVEALASTGQTDEALTELQTLLAREPEKALEYRKRMGQLQLDDGRIEDGLATFNDVVESDPGNWQARADLASAEQRAGNWFRAVETWQQAWERAPGEARAGILPSLLNAATRLQRREDALDFFEKAISGESQPEWRDDLLREAARYASRNGVSANWQARLDARIQAAPQETSWRLGRAWLLQENGQPEEARESLSEVGDEDVTAGAMLAAAEAAKNWAEAARLLERQISRSQGDDPALAITRAEYLQRAGDGEQARTAWEFVTRRYARNPEALTAAAEYFERIGEETRSEAYERAAAELGGCPPEVLFRLGQRALERGDRTQALADFEAVLARTQPDPFAAREFFPLPEVIRQSPDPTMASVSFLPSGARTRVRAPEPWPRVTASAGQGCRLLAIEEIGRLVINRPDKSSWIEGFVDPREKIWAAYAAGDRDQALAGIETLSREAEASLAVGQIFSALALVEGKSQARRLIRWADEESEEPLPGATRWSQVGEAFGRLVRAGWEPDADACEEVFRAAPALERWQVARELAGLRRYRLAVGLGETVPDDLSPSQAAAAWLEISRWWAALRNPDRVLASLNRALAVAPLAVGYDNVFFSALRARWLLTLPGDRANFVQGLSPLWNPTARPAAEAAARALLAALAGQFAESNEQLEQVFAQQEEVGDGDRVQEIQRGGARLEEWNLPQLARALYREDLARDPVLAAMDGANDRTATEALFIANLLENADAKTVPYLVNEWMARGVSDEELLHAASRLQQSGHGDASLRVFANLTARNPRNLQIVIGIVNMALSPEYTKVARPFLEGLLVETDGKIPPPVMLGAALRIAGLLERGGDSEAALELLERVAVALPFLPGVTLPRVQLLLSMGRFPEARDLLNNAVAGSTAPEPGLLRPLVELIVGFGREGEAQSWLEKFPTVSVAERAGAEMRLRELLQSATPSLLPAPARAEAEWARLLGTLDQLADDPEKRFARGHQFLRDHRDLPLALRGQELRRLDVLSRREPARRPTYYLLRKELADSPEELLELTESMRAEWDRGRGSYLAGEIYLQLLLEQKSSEELETVLGDYLTDRHFNEPAWDEIGRQLLTSGRPRLAARVFSALLTRRPGSPERALLLAEALGKSDRLAVGREIVAPLRRLAALDPELYLELARYDLAVGDPASARAELWAAERNFSGQAPLAELWGRLAEVDLAQGRSHEAREAILLAMKSPSFRAAGLVADYDETVGELSAVAPTSNAFGLGLEALADWKIEMATRLLARGQSERAWAWIEADPLPVTDPRWRNLLRQLAESHPAKVERLWEIALQHPSWDLRVEAAQFYLQRANRASDPEAALRDLDRAQTLHPGSFAIVRAYAEKLLQQGNPAGARKALRDLIAAYALPRDRRAASEMLARLEASPALPQGR